MKQMASIDDEHSSFLRSEALPLRRCRTHFRRDEY